MKQFCILIFAIAITFNLNAQIQKGALLTGGSFGFNSQKSTNEFSISSGPTSPTELNYSYLSINPKIGFFTSPSVVLGIGLFYRNNVFEQNDNSNGGSETLFKQKTSEFLLNPYLTKYSKLAENLYFTTTINLLAGPGKGKYGQNDDNESSTFTFGLNVTPGLTYFVSKNWALNCNIGQLFYNYTEEKLTTATGLPEDPKNVTNEYGLNVSFNTFTIGFQYLLNVGE